MTVPLRNTTQDAIDSLSCPRHVRVVDPATAGGATCAEQNLLPTNLESADLHFFSQHIQARRRGYGGRLRVGEERGVRGELFADGPRTRSGNDDSAGIGEDDGVERSLVARVRQRIMKCDEWVGAAPAAAVVAEHGKIELQLEGNVSHEGIFAL